MVFKLPKCSLDSGPSPFWLDWLGEGSISSSACCTATHLSWLNSRIYLSAILFSAKNPFPTSPPDFFCKISQFKGVNLVRSCRNESFALSNKALLGGSWLAPLFSTIIAGVDPLCDTDEHEEEGRQRKCKREEQRFPTQSMLLTQPQSCWMKVACLLSATS